MGSERLTPSLSAHRTAALGFDLWDFMGNSAGSDKKMWILGLELRSNEIEREGGRGNEVLCCGELGFGQCFCA